jgi:hypothetical protein
MHRPAKPDFRFVVDFWLSLLRNLLNPNISNFYVTGIMPISLSSSEVFLVDSELCHSLLILTFFSSERNRNRSCGENFLFSSCFFIMAAEQGDLNRGGATTPLEAYSDILI